jgi:hypothetical protein
VGEFSGDSDPDIAAANELCHNVSVLGGGAGGSFGGLTNSPAGNLPDDLAVGEFNGDADRDIAVANQSSDNVSVLVGAGGLGFVGPIDYPAGDGPSAVAIADFNADAKPDLAVTNELVDNISILLATTNDGYPRPLSASPQILSLVPAYNACAPAAANRTHGPPLENPSCNPPAQTSGFLTVGTSDANSNSPQSVGSVAYRVCLASPCGSGTAPDVKLQASIKDVRNTTGLTDYVGELQARVNLRITDRANGGSLTDAATLGDRVFSFTLPCTATGGTASVGSTCAVTTRANAVVPGLVVAGKRSLWQMSQVELLDGGPDEDVDTPAGNTVFARQGLFVP